MAVHRRPCDGCGAVMPEDARWCGRCGAAQPLRARAGTGRRAGRRRTPRWSTPALTTAGLLGVLAVAIVATTVVDGSARGGTGSPVDIEQDLGSTATGPATESPTCTWERAGGEPCGPVVVDDLRRVTAAEPLGDDALLVARRGGDVERIDLPGGRVQWSSLAFPGSDDVAVHTDGEVVLAVRRGAVARLDPVSGDVRWNRGVGAADSLLPPRTWLLDGTAMLLEEDRTLTAIDVADGRTRWQATAPGNDAILTAEGLVTVGPDRTSLWHPDDGERWTRDPALTPKIAPRGPRADGPLPLLSGAGLLDPATGQGIDHHASGPTVLRVAGPLTLQLRWPGGGTELEVTALGPGGEIQWVRAGLDVPCCLAAVVPATGERVALVPPRPEGVVVSLDDGSVLARLEPPAELDSAALMGVAADLAVWRGPDGLVGAPFDGSEVALTLGPGTSLLSLEPFLVTDGEQITAIVDPPPAGTSIATGRDWPVCRDGGEPVACVRWQQRLRPHERVTVMAAHRRVVTAGTDGAARGFDLWSGELAWSMSVPGAPPPRLLPVVAGTVPIAVAGHVLFVDLGTGAHVGRLVDLDPGLAATAPGLLLTADADRISAWGVDGSLGWSHEVDADATPILTSNGAYLAGPTGALTRLLGTTGGTRWQVQLRGVAHDVAATGDGAVVAADAGIPQLIGIDDRGNERWRRNLRGPARWLEVGADDRVAAVIADGPDGARLSVVDPATGALAATTRLAERASGTLPPAIRGTSVAVAHAGPQPQLTVVDGDRIVLRTPLERIPRGVAFAGPGTVAVADGSSITLWDVDDGAVRWRARLGASTDLLLGEPLVAVGDRGIVAFDVEG